jgi:hypothetical protein
MVTDAGIPVMHQQVDSVCKELHGLLLQALCQSWSWCLHVLWIFGPLVLSWGDQTHGSHMVIGSGWMVNGLAHSSAWNTVCFAQKDTVMQHSDISHGHNRTNSVDGTHFGLFATLSTRNWMTFGPVCTNVPVLLHSSLSAAGASHTHSRVSSTVSCVHCQHHEQVSFEQLSYIMYNNHFNISLQRQKIPHFLIYM